MSLAGLGRGRAVSRARRREFAQIGGSLFFTTPADYQPVAADVPDFAFVPATEVASPKGLSWAQPAWGHVPHDLFAEAACLLNDLILERAAARQSEFERKRRTRFESRQAEIRGQLKRQACESCGEPNVEIHHDDYDDPYAVRWLCEPCHVREHFPHRQAA